MKKWIVSYYLTSDGSVATIQLMAHEAFNEIPEYNDEEAKKVVEYIRSKKVPEFKETHWWGDKTYSEWEEFKTQLNKEIKTMIYGTENL